jgi:hypothetical protein
MAKLPRRPESNTSHLAGEYFVAAELYKRGYSVAMTLGNAKAIDLFVERGLRTANVQVKAIRLRRNVGWPILKSKVFSRVVYVLVCLNDEATAPTFFIGTASEIRPRIREYPQPNGTTRGILNYGSINSAQFKGRWDKVEAALHKAVDRA